MRRPVPPATKQAMELRSEDRRDHALRGHGYPNPHRQPGAPAGRPCVSRLGAVRGSRPTLDLRAVADAVRRFAAGLQVRGVATGERVLVHLDSCPESLIAWLGRAALVEAVPKLATHTGTPLQVRVGIDRRRAEHALALLLLSSSSGCVWLVHRQPQFRGCTLPAGRADVKALKVTHFAGGYRLLSGGCELAYPGPSRSPPETVSPRAPSVLRSRSPVTCIPRLL